MKETLEKQFGTDEAFGLRYTNHEGSYYPFDYNQLTQEQRQQVIDEGWESVFPDGRSATVCTNYAYFIEDIYKDRAQVVGFANKDNPLSRIAREDIHPTGHDFCLIDKRYLVDPWIRLVHGTGTEPMVFDLHDLKDREIVLDMYGSDDCWKHFNQRYEPENAANESNSFELI